jgi:hypothetical protein
LAKLRRCCGRDRALTWAEVRDVAHLEGDAFAAIVATVAILILLVVAIAVVAELLVAHAHAVTATKQPCHGADEVSGLSRIAADELTGLLILSQEPFIAGDLPGHLLVLQAEPCRRRAAAGRTCAAEVALRRIEAAAECPVAEGAIARRLPHAAAQRQAAHPAPHSAHAPATHPPAVLSAGNLRGRQQGKNRQRNVNNGLLHAIYSTTYFGAKQQNPQFGTSSLTHFKARDAKRLEPGGNLKVSSANFAPLGNSSAAPLRPHFTYLH